MSNVFSYFVISNKVVAIVQIAFVRLDNNPAFCCDFIELPLHIVYNFALFLCIFTLIYFEVYFLISLRPPNS